MAKQAKKIYVCKKCGAQAPKWSGRCLECGSWGTLEEGLERGRDELIRNAPPADFINLSRYQEGPAARLSTKIGEFDRVLGGGLVSGSLTLLAGEPGIGKSTVLAQLIGQVCRHHEIPVFYISGEESAGQIKDRFERLGLDLERVNFLNETNSESVIKSLQSNRHSVVVVDSIQTVYSGAVNSEAGSISQIRAVTMQFLELAKHNDITVIIVGHITKDGQVAGPKTLEHMVDTVLYLESGKNDDFRVLRAQKNRFGGVNEVGIFEMGGQGLMEVKNPAEIFLADSKEPVSGSILSVIMKGSRPFLVEVQALVSKTIFGYPQRKASGFDINRLQMLTAVLTRKGGVNLVNQDVIVNIAGGLKIIDPAVDLAVCAAIVSSLLNRRISRQTIAVGEIGLGGEVRNITRLKERLYEAKKLGIGLAFVPPAGKTGPGPDMAKVSNIRELAEKI